MNNSELWLRFAEAALNGVTTADDADKYQVAASRACFVADEMLKHFSKRFPEPKVPAPASSAPVSR